MSQHQLLVEIGCEELPPTTLTTLSDAFAAAFAEELAAVELAFEAMEAFATPRRLALRVSGLPASTPVRTRELWGPPAKIAFDDEGRPTKAALAFAQKNGTDVDALQVANDGKVDKLLFKSQVGGESTADLLATMVGASLARLPIGKRMRWGSTREEFVRPVHWLVMLLDSATVAGSVLGLRAGRSTRGHRFHANRAVELRHASEYEAALQDAFVLANFDRRRTLIEQQVIREGERLGGRAVITPELLDEVTALVEWPVAITGRFDERFLKVPAEALISSMKEHQKYFHVHNADGQLMPSFITVANIESTDMAQVVAGNEKVIRPRLADAAFFFEQDQKTPLEHRRENLKNMVFQAKLGSLYDKTERIATLAERIAEQTGADAAVASRAGRLSKADLVTSMVYEFADMQGIAGYYYARNDGEDEAVARALEEQYLPKFAGDDLPQTATGTVLALADRLDTLAGIFGLGMVPSGSKDPFALRRASVAVLRLLVEKRYALDLRQLLTEATASYADLPRKDSVDLALAYMLERMRAWYEEDGIDPAIYLAVQAKNLSVPLDIDARVRAVAQFSRLPASASLASANKRVSNLLAKQADPTAAEIDHELLNQPEERNLAAQIERLRKQIAPLVARGEYTQTLTELAELRQPVDAFFDAVLVMADDARLRANRLALLAQLRDLFLEVADISHLAGAQ